MSLKDFQSKIGVTADGAWGPGTLKAAVEFLKMPKVRAAHFFAQTSHESGGFKSLSENLNYSADGLVKIFHKYFPDVAVATPYARNPEKIANKVYGGRMGNGDEASGDGFKYRGRGAIQLTGKDNYAAFAKAIGRPDVLTNPDIVSGELAFESAMFFFDKNKLWDICDKGINDETITALTKRINGGTIGLEERKNHTYEYAKLLGV
jgi:putative chitinase